MPPKACIDGSISRTRLAQAKEVFQRAKEERERRAAGEVSGGDDDDFQKQTPKSLSLLDAGVLNNKAGVSTSRKKGGKPKKLSSFNANSSMSSISELEPVLVFDESQCTNMSSLSQLTISNGSLQLSFSNCVTQGPSLFESDRQEKVSEAPRLPQRRGASVSDAGYDGEGSDSSLSLEDILEESTNHSASSNATATTEATTADSGGRQWSEPSTSAKANNMPIRSESVRAASQDACCSETNWLSGSSFAEDDSCSSHLSHSTSSIDEHSAASLHDSSGAFEP